MWQQSRSSNGILKGSNIEMSDVNHDLAMFVDAYLYIVGIFFYSITQLLAVENY